MLYLLGGAPRTGKTIIARRLVKEKLIPYLSTDMVVAGVENISSLGIQHSQPFVPKAEKLWPILKPLYNEIIRYEENYFIEGDGILPKFVAEYESEHKNEIRACFLGYTQISLDSKVHNIRQYNDPVNDWTNKYSDEQLSEAVKKMIEFSHYLQEECLKYNIKFFDTSNNFTETLDDVFNYLTMRDPETSSG